MTKEEVLSHESTRNFLHVFESWRFIKIINFLLKSYNEERRWVGKMDLRYSTRSTQSEMNRTINALIDLGIIKKSRKGGWVGYRINVDRYNELEVQYKSLVKILLGT